MIQLRGKHADSRTLFDTAAALLPHLREAGVPLLINDRLAPGQDLVTPENRIPAEGLRDENGDPMRWESCMCLNGNWGYVRDDRRYKDAGRVVRIEQRRTTIGRGIAADIQLEDPAVSRTHARITRNPDGRHFIEDLCSTNGTFVCGQPIRR